ncbi:MAG TPA: DNA-3-methyladenine glycosylase 2 family protein [Actinomycetota bacterium]|nr:DNA-3-methyladenine glycosylase 2 family protein [Actinomycetota bacterium]
MRVSERDILRASRTPDGPVTVRFGSSKDGVDVEVWGPGAGWMLERAPAWCGALDDVDGFDPPPGVVRDLWRRRRGLRITRTGLITERLIPIVLEQKVTGGEARRAYRRLTHSIGELAPGPYGLLMPPDPARVAEMAYFEFHPFGVEQRRANVLRTMCSRGAWLDGAETLPLDGAKTRIGSLHGIGPWSVAEVARIALGDADAVSVGDYHVPNIVAWALAREPRGTDERMLELLEPFRPHRGRVQALLEQSGIGAPAFGPRMEVRAIDRI